MQIRIRYHLLLVLLLFWVAQQVQAQSCTINWNSLSIPEYFIIRDTDGGVKELSNWGYSSASCSLSLSLEIDSVTQAYLSSKSASMTGSNGDTNKITVKSTQYHWSLWPNPTNDPVAFRVNLKDSSGYVYRSTPVVFYIDNPKPKFEDVNPVTGLTYVEMFGLGDCEFTLMSGVSSTGFIYLNGPSAQSFQLFDMSQTLDACTLVEVFNGSTWSDISSNPAFSVDYTSGQLTVQSTDVGKTTQLRVDTTQFNVVLCQYAYFSDSAAGVPNIPPWLDEASGPTNEFVLPKVHRVPTASCPVAQNPTISGLAPSNYSTGGTNDLDKFNIFIAGTSFVPITTETVVLSSIVAGRTSPVQYTFTFQVGGTNPACIGSYTGTETGQLAAAYPTPIYIINDSFTQDFVFPANPNADFTVCDHSLEFKGADIASSAYSAISVTKRASDFLVSFDMSGGKDLSLYTGQNVLTLTHGTGTIDLTIVLCQVVLPTITTSPYMTVVKWAFSPPMVLPMLTDSHSSCHSILTYSLTVAEPTATVSATVSYDAGSQSQQAVLNTVSSNINTFPASYQAKDKNTGVLYTVGFDIKVVDNCLAETASAAQPSISKIVYVDASSPDLQTSYGTFTYAACGQTVDAFKATCKGQFSNGTPCTTTQAGSTLASSPAGCSCRAILADFSQQKVVLTLSNLPAYASSLQVLISGWNNVYGIEPNNPQISIDLNLLKCSDQQFEFQVPQLNTVETYTFKSGLQNYQFGWPTIQDEVTNQCQPVQKIEMLFGQTKANIVSDETIDSVFTLVQDSPASLVFTINTDHNMDSLMSYNEDSQLPINITFHVRVFDADGQQIQAQEQSFNVHIQSDCSLPKTQILDAIILSNMTLDVGGQQKCSGPLKYLPFFAQLSDRLMCPIDILSDITLSHNFGLKSKVKGSKFLTQNSPFQIFKLDDETFEVCFQALSNDQIKGYQVGGFNQICSLDSDQTCMIPFRVEMQSQDGTLGTIYSGMSIWNRLNDQANSLNQAPYVQDFDSKERLYEVGVDSTTMIEIGPIVGIKEDSQVFVNKLSPDNSQFDPWIKNYSFALNKHGEMMLYIEVSVPKEAAGQFTSVDLAISDQQSADAQSNKYKFVLSVPEERNSDVKAANLDVKNPENPEDSEDQEDLENPEDQEDSKNPQDSEDQENREDSKNPEDSEDQEDQEHSEVKETQLENNDNESSLTYPPNDSEQSSKSLEKDVNSDSQDDQSDSSSLRTTTVSVMVRRPDLYGVLQLEISRSISLPANYTNWSSLNEGVEMLDIKFEPSSETIDELELEGEQLDGFFSWRILNRNGQLEQDQWELRSLTSSNNVSKVAQLDVQLEFIQPLIVSSGLKELDQLQVKVKQRFFESDGVTNFTTRYEGVEYVNQTIPIKLNRQVINKELISLLQTVVEAIEKTVLVFSSTNIFASMFVTGLLQYLWAIINVLQMITQTALFSAILPINAQILMFALLRLGNLDLYNTTGAYQAIFNFKVMEPLNAQFSLAGYDSTNFVIESGTLLIGTVGFLIYIVTIFGLKKVLESKRCRVRDNWLTRRIKRKQNYHVQIKRFFLQGCFGLGLAVAFQLCDQKQREFEHTPDSISFVLALVQIAIYALLIAYIIYAASKVYKKKGDYASYKLAFSYLRMNKIGALAFDVIFLMRRFLVICLITVLAEEQIVQIQLYLFASLASLLYLITMKPFEEDLMLKGEILNEVGILLVSYTLAWFTDYVVDPEQEFDIGWSIIAIIVLVVFCNCVIFGIALIRKIKRQCKKCIAKRSYKNKQKKLSSAKTGGLLKNSGDLVQAKVKSFNSSLGSTLKQIDPKNPVGSKNCGGVSNDVDRSGDKEDDSSNSQSISSEESKVLAVALVNSYKEVSDSQHQLHERNEIQHFQEIQSSTDNIQLTINKTKQQEQQHQKSLLIDTRSKGGNGSGNDSSLLRRDSNQEDVLMSLEEFQQQQQSQPTRAAAIIPKSIKAGGQSFQSSSLFKNLHLTLGQAQNQQARDNRVQDMHVQERQTTKNKNPVVQFQLKAVEVQKMQTVQTDVQEGDSRFVKGRAPYYVVPSYMKAPVNNVASGNNAVSGTNNVKSVQLTSSSLNDGRRRTRKFMSNYAAEKEKTHLERSQRLDRIQRRQ